MLQDSTQDLSIWTHQHSGCWVRTHGSQHTPCGGALRCLNCLGKEAERPLLMHGLVGMGWVGGVGLHSHSSFLPLLPPLLLLLLSLILSSSSNCLLVMGGVCIEHQTHTTTEMGSGLPYQVVGLHGNGLQKIQGVFTEIGKK